MKHYKTEKNARTKSALGHKNSALSRELNCKKHGLSCQLRHISKWRKNLNFLNSEMPFFTTYLYCPGETIIQSGKGFLHRKALYIDFEKCNFGKRLLTPSAASPPKSSLGFFSGNLGWRPLLQSLDIYMLQ